MRLRYVLGCASVLALAASVHAQTAVQPQPRPVQPVNPYPPSLYQMNDVGKSLNLTPEQVARLNKLTEQTQATYRDDFGKLNDLKADERFMRQQELNRKYYGDWNKAARDVFNDEQRTRYQQLYYQHGGFNSLYDPDVQKSLNLTPEQMKNLRESVDWSNQQYQDINKLGMTDREKGMKMYEDYQKSHQERFNKFLTPEQQKTWREMTGEPYTFRPAFGTVRER